MKRFIRAFMILLVLLMGSSGELHCNKAYAAWDGPVHWWSFGYVVDYSDGILANDAAMMPLSLDDDLTQVYVSLVNGGLRVGEETKWVVTTVGAQKPITFYYRLYRQELDEESSTYWSVAGSALRTDSNEYSFVIPNEGRYFLKFEITYEDGDSYVYKTLSYETSTEALEAKIREVVSECAYSGLSDYEKALNLHDWLCENAEYDDTYSYYQADGVLLNGKGVCMSFTLAYQELLAAAGVENICVLGYANGGSHSWNMVKLDGDWYHVDVTWDENRSDKYYFGMSEKLMCRDHTLTTRAPKATATKYNYALNHSDGAFESVSELAALMDALPVNQEEFNFYCLSCDDISAQINRWFATHYYEYGFSSWNVKNGKKYVRSITGTRKLMENVELVDWNCSVNESTGAAVLNMTLETGLKTTAVELCLPDGTLIAAYTDGYTDHAKRRTWTISREFVDDGKRKLLLKALKADGTVIAEIEGEYALTGYSLRSAKFDQTEAVQGETVTVTAKSNQGANYLHMYSENGSLIKTWKAADYSKISGNARVWNVSYVFSGAGQRTMTFKASADEASFSKGISSKLTVTKAPAVTGVEMPGVAYKGQSFSITVHSEEKAQYLTMFAENGGKVKSWPQSNSSVVDGVRVWKVSYAVNGTMGLRNLTFKTSVNDSTMGDGQSAKILIVDSVPAVSAAAFKESKAGRCWEATLVATTNADATQLKMYTEAGALTKTWTASDSNSRVVGTERIWTVTHAFTGVGSRTMTFKATKDGSTMGQGQSAKIEIVSDYALNDADFVSSVAYASQKTRVEAESGWTAKYLYLYSETGALAKSWTADGNSTVSDGVRKWNVEYAFGGTGSRNVSFKTSEDGKTYSAAKNSEILIVSGAPAVSYAKFASDEIGKGQSVSITVKTNADATQVKLYSEAGALAKTWTASDSNSEVNGTERIWTLSYSFGGAGNRTLTFKATKDGSTMGAGKTASITVK